MGQIWRPLQIIRGGGGPPCAHAYVSDLPIDFRWPLCVQRHSYLRFAFPANSGDTLRWVTQPSSAFLLDKWVRGCCWLCCEQCFRTQFTHQFSQPCVLYFCHLTCWCAPSLWCRDNLWDDLDWSRSTLIGDETFSTLVGGNLQGTTTWRYFNALQG